MNPRKYKALFLDFYGTLVKEDGRIIDKIVDAIADGSPAKPGRKEILTSWNFTALCAISFGANFQTQRTLEQQSLARLLEQYQVELDAEVLSAELFDYWRSPDAFVSAGAFLDGVDIPICVVSNIDTADLAAAIDCNGWQFTNVITSQQCQAYKPRPEPFVAGLKMLGVQPADVLHIGDGLGSDIAGANDMGIDCVWINRNNRPLPEDPRYRPTYEVADLDEVTALFD